MKNLLYKTRNGDGVKGKPRVYVCTHPSEEHLALELAEELLRRRDCALYYKEDSTQSAAEEDLKEMQLIVVAVTAEFLSRESVAWRELAFAQSEHVPILPLAQSVGLEEKFNETFGELQLLGKSIQDSTAISFEEKLEKYLSEVLFEDELAKHVREEFKGYVFLSYRKKDRAHAQRLMRYIHSLPFYEDVAIWYDEFLTPGELYGEEIEAALHKSEFMALVVTPNVADGENYVSTTEYPMARLAGKRVLPIELVKTDYARLEQTFEGLEPPISIDDTEALEEAFLRSSNLFTKEGNFNGARHAYYVGQAYLHGIDVEVDRPRGVRLLKASAKAGYWQAMYRLAHMYKNGDGVQRDLVEAMLWQEQEVLFLEREKERFAKAWGEDDANDMRIEAYYLLAELRKSLWGFEPARSDYIKALRIVNERLKRGKAEMHYVTDYASLCLSIGECYFSEKDYTNAERYYGYAYSVMDGLKQQGCAETQVLRTLTVTREKMGACALMQMDVTRAKEYLTQGIAEAERLTESEPSAQNRAMLAVMYQRQALANTVDGDDAVIERAYLASCSILDSLMRYASETESKEYGKILLANTVGLLRLYTSQGRWTEAQLYCRRTLETAEQMLQGDPKDFSVRTLTCQAYTEAGQFYAAIGELALAESYFQKTLTMGERLVEGSKGGVVVDGIFEGILSAYEGLAELSEQQELWSDAAEYYRREIAFLQNILAESTDTDLQNSLACAQYNLYRYCAETEEGKTALRTARALWSELLETLPEDDPDRESILENLALVESELQSC